MYGTQPAFYAELRRKTQSPKSSPSCVLREARLLAPNDRTFLPRQASDGSTRAVRILTGSYQRRTGGMFSSLT
jgi:hypothetical protein